MAKRTRVVIRRKAIKQMLKGQGEFSGVREDLERRARAIAEAAGEGMEVDSAVGKNRVRVSVRTATPEAVRAEYENRDLTDALDAGRR